MSEPPPSRGRIRAPSEAGQALILPSLAGAGQLARQNEEHLAQQELAFLPGANAWRQQARRELLTAAERYTKSYSALESLAEPVSAQQPIILTGHQPELFHPGVWLKNFVASSLAQQTGGIAVNLVIDNDTQRQASLAVPTGSWEQPQVTAVPYDDPLPELPHEERPLVNRESWASFPTRVIAALRPVAEAAGWDCHDLCLSRLTETLQSAGKRTEQIGYAFAQARHRLEQSVGVRTWELPLSVLCQQPAFQAFVIGLLTDLPRLQSVYNAALANYRRKNRLRSRSHPAPDLEQTGEWREVPLWIWSRNAPRRQRAFARWTNGQLEISDRQALSVQMPRAEDLSNGAAFAEWSAAEARGIKLRPRAFLTTLFARLMLGDLFIHGIGGAKYDEVTDELIRELAGVAPPAFVIATATLPLPFSLPPVTEHDLQVTRQLLRDFRFHPERFAPPTQTPGFHFISAEAWRRLLEEKQAWLALQPQRGQGTPRQNALSRLNEALAAALPDQARSLQALLAEQESLLAKRRLLGNREFSFVLHPSERLTRQLLDLSSVNS